MLSLLEKKYLNLLNIAFCDNFTKLLSLFKQYNSFEKILQEETNLSEKVKDKDLEKEWQKLEQQKIDLLFFQDKQYPNLLRETHLHPISVYFQGDLSVLTKPMIAIVGTRKATDYGKSVAEKLTKELIDYGFIIVSGLASGIDTIVHQSAVSYGGQTIAVLGTGINIIFPVTNKKLSEKIINKGALISEYPLDIPPAKYHFPARNRIISGLSLGTIIIEAPEKSGALITAQFALQQNREVFAIPGSIYNKNSCGPHKLIQEGAKLVTSVDDILEELKIYLPDIHETDQVVIKNKKIIFENIIEEKIYQELNFEKAISVDELVIKINLPTNEILMNLTLLELKGFIKRVDNGNYLKNNY